MAALTGRVAVDAPTLVTLCQDALTVPTGRRLVGPATLRSDALALVWAAVREGSLAPDAAPALLERLTTTPLRLLGDRVSRATAWRLATEQGLATTRAAEYVAVARLQADVLVASDPDVVAVADGVVPLAAYADLRETLVGPDDGPGAARS